MIWLIRAATWLLLAASALVAVFDGNTHLFVALAYLALVGVLVLGIRARWRRDRMRRPS